MQCFGHGSVTVILHFYKYGNMPVINCPGTNCTATAMSALHKIDE